MLVQLSLSEQLPVSARCKGIGWFVSAARGDSTVPVLVIEGRLFAFPFFFGLIFLYYHLGNWKDSYFLTRGVRLCFQAFPMSSSRDLLQAPSEEGSLTSSCSLWFMHRYFFH